MSPSESDLRAALHDGEAGGVLNVDHVIVNVQAAAAQRRVRLMSGAAIVAVVLGTGVGVGYLAAGNSGSEGGANSDVAGGAVSAPQAKGSSASAADRAGSGTQGGLAYAAQVPCPRTFPNYLLPGGGGLDQFGADGPLFSKPVTAVVVCGYGSKVKRLDIVGQQAADLATSLENASKAKSTASCPGLPSNGLRRYAIVGLAGGSRVGTVTATLPNTPCTVAVTNGTAVRYSWSPPPDLRRQLLNLTE